ncbi:endolytic transglycosylase MltG [Liberibacter crescens]|nr:endolytic transglycosylase MltG [Liberibacter crescens]
MRYPNKTIIRHKLVVPRSARQILQPEEVYSSANRSRIVRKKIVIFLNFLMTMAVLITFLILLLYYCGASIYNKPGPLPVNSIFLIQNGESLQDIMDNLIRNNIISDNRVVFQYMTRLHLGSHKLQAGEYEIKKSASMAEVIEIIRSGKRILHSVSFPEGLTVKQILKRLKEHPILEGDLPSQLPIEGSLRPDTYKFSWGTKRMEIIEQARFAQQKLVDDIWERRDRDLPIKNKKQFVILASIVEKETGRSDERAHVASVFMNRLKKGIKLQSDPTIIYGIFEGEAKPKDRPIYQSDLDKKTPYNSYVIKGLPPTAISNPGRASLEAVANPSHTDDLYFVSDGMGGHVFSKTLKEHNINVQHFRQINSRKKDKTN